MYRVTAYRDRDVLANGMFTNEVSAYSMFEQLLMRYASETDVRVRFSASGVKSA